MQTAPEPRSAELVLMPDSKILCRNLVWPPLEMHHFATVPQSSEATSTPAGSHNPDHENREHSVERRAVTRMINRYVRLGGGGVRSTAGRIAIDESRVTRSDRNAMPSLDDWGTPKYLDAIRTYVIRQAVYAIPEIRSDLLLEDGTPMPSGVRLSTATPTVRCRPSRRASEPHGVTWSSSVAGLLGQLPSGSGAAQVRTVRPGDHCASRCGRAARPPRRRQGRQGAPPAGRSRGREIEGAGKAGV